MQVLTVEVHVFARKARIMLRAAEHAGERQP